MGFSIFLTLDAWIVPVCAHGTFPLGWCFVRSEWQQSVILRLLFVWPLGFGLDGYQILLPHCIECGPAAMPVPQDLGGGV